MTIENNLEIIEKSYNIYLSILEQLKNNINNFSYMKQLYINLLFEFSYNMEMLYQDHDIELYNDMQFTEDDLINEVKTTIISLTKLIHLLNINNYFEIKQYKYYELWSILNLLKDISIE